MSMRTRRKWLFLEDAGWAVMRAGAGLWDAAASAAATAGRMKGMSSRRSSGVGGLGGPAVTWRHCGPIKSAAGGEGGAGLRSAPSGFGWARILQCLRVWVGVYGGKQFVWAAFRGRAGWTSGSGGVCGGRVQITERAGCFVGRWAPCGGCVRVAGCAGW